MTKCANCDNDAIYFVAFTDTHFCERDLPNFLRAEARAGGLALPKAAKPVAAPVVEAPVEEEPVEAPKPAKTKAPEGK